MPVILKDAPAGYNWGWYSREDPRMHLQPVTRKHAKLPYKIWLERQGKRVFEPDGEIPAKILKAVRSRVAIERPSIEAEWVHFMIEQNWLTYRLHGTIMILIAYPNTPNRFEREVDLTPHLGISADAFTLKDVRLNSEYAVIELWPHERETRRPFIRLWPILWQG